MWEQEIAWLSLRKDENDEILRMLQHPDPAERLMALKHPNANPLHFQWILEHEKDPDILTYAVSNDKTPLEAIKNFVSKGDLSSLSMHLRNTILDKDNLPPDFLEEYFKPINARYTGQEVPIPIFATNTMLPVKLAKHPNITSDQVCRLVTDERVPSSTRVNLLASDTKMGPNELKRILDQALPKIRESTNSFDFSRSHSLAWTISQHPNATPEVLTYGMEGGQHGEVQAGFWNYVAQRPNLDPTIKLKILHGGERVAQAAHYLLQRTGSENWTPEIAEAVINHPDGGVRSYIAKQRVAFLHPEILSSDKVRQFFKEHPEDMDEWARYKAIPEDMVDEAVLSSALGPRRRTIMLQDPSYKFKPETFQHLVDIDKKEGNATFSQSLLCRNDLDAGTTDKIFDLLNDSGLGYDNSHLLSYLFRQSNLSDRVFEAGIQSKAHYDNMWNARALPADRISKLLDSPNLEFDNISSIWSQRQLNEEHLRKILAKSEQDPIYGTFLGEYMNKPLIRDNVELQKDILRVGVKLLHRSDLAENVAENATDPTVLQSAIDLGLGHDSPPLLTKALSNEHVAPQTLADFYYNTSNPAMKAHVLLNRRTPPGVFQDVLKHADTDPEYHPLVAKMLDNPRLLPNELNGAIAFLASQPDTGFQQGLLYKILQHPDLTDEGLKGVRAHPLWHPDWEGRYNEINAEMHPDATEGFEPVMTKIGSHKFRRWRDRVLKIYHEAVRNNPKLSNGKLEVPKTMLPPGDYTGGKVKGSRISADALQATIDAMPSLRVNISHDLISPPYQRHDMNTPSKVFQVNLSNDHVKKLKEAGLWHTWRKVYEYLEQFHPITPHTFGWVRWTGNPRDGVFWDELQSDWLATMTSKLIGHVKHRYNEMRLKGENPNPADEEQEIQEQITLAKRKELDEEDQKAIQKILFGKTHPHEILAETMLQNLRDLGHHRTKIRMRSADMIDKNRELVSMKGSTTPLPIHVKYTYDELPRKKMLFDMTHYGEIPTEVTEKYKNSQTYGTDVSKHLKEVYQNLAHSLALLKSEKGNVIPHIQGGLLVNEGDPTIYDYSHVLSKAHRESGYELELHEFRGDYGPEWKVYLTVGYEPISSLEKNEVGQLHGWLDGTDCYLNLADISDEKGKDGQPLHKGQGLGRAMAEAMLAHAYHQHGASHMAVGVHSTDAGYMLKSLKKHHKIPYQERPNVDEQDTPSGAFDDKYLGGRYQIP